MRLWKLITRHMVVKVFLAIGLGIGVALSVQAYLDATREAATLKAETRKWAEQIAQLFIGAVEHSMREGDGIKVEKSLADLRARVDQAARVRIYDPRGIEVFSAKPPPPPRAELDPTLAAVLDSSSRQVADDGRILRPVPNEERCHKCHDADGPLRGVLEFDISQSAFTRMREEVLATIITAGFVQVMAARREHLLDDYFTELIGTDQAFDQIAVFDSDSDLRYGVTITDLAPDTVRALLVRGAQAQSQTSDDRTLALIPLPMQERCVACHDDEIGTVRGVLAIAMNSASAADRQTSDDLEDAIDTSLRYIMLSELGRRIADFLDEVAASQAVEELTLYDHVGRRFWTTSHPEPSVDIAEVLETRKPQHRYIGDGVEESLLAVAPLHNSKDCVRCHGTDSELRGAVAVEVSTEIAAMTRAKLIRQRTWFTAATLLGILALLGWLLHYLVARPVRRIGDVADQIGEGNLGVTVQRANPGGDEIARLGQRINEMVRGLRTKMNLEKFVSRGAAAAAAGAGLRPLDQRGERRRVTVLFSDIRGFTAYSEKVAPEKVVEMLNRLLRAQAEMVVESGGDIDKYVGDELMAVFTGEDAEERAMRCAMRMVAAVHDARREDETLEVGIGIS
ncbi:MAG: adenylate/guanylate cyclase domain-containing protein, partial [Myxococcota bacterium]